MKRASETVLQFLVAAKKARTTTTKLQLPLGLTLTVLAYNDSKTTWCMWMRTCRRNLIIGMSRPAYVSTKFDICPLGPRLFTAVAEHQFDFQRVLQLQGMLTTHQMHQNISVKMVDLSLFTALTHLDVSLLDPIADLSAIGDLTGLTQLSLRTSSLDPTLFTDFSWMCTLTQVCRLKMAGFPAGTDLGCCVLLDSLEKLELDNVAWDPSIWPTLTHLTELTLTNIYGNPSLLDNLDALACLDLDELNLSQIRGITELPVLTELSFLKRLSITHLPDLSFSNCPAMFTLPRLTWLQIIGNTNRSYPMPRLTLTSSLRVIRILGVDLCDLLAFTELPVLEELVIVCPFTSAFPDIEIPLRNEWVSPQLTKVSITRSCAW